MADEQDAPVGSGPGERVERLTGLEAAGERRVDRHQLALLVVPRLDRELRGLRGADLRAVEDRVEARPHAGDRHTGRARLLLAPLGQAAGRILPASMRLGLCVSE